MSGFRTGSFDRDRIASVWHRFLPAQAVNSLLDIDPARLWEEGKRLILLDVDHTIVKWRAEEIPQGVEDWVQRAKSVGFDLCILSNTRNPERLARLAARLNIETVRDKFKPSPAMFRLAMIKFKRKPEESIMIGDQIFTDILGANRSGIDAIWVQKMEGNEFAGTKVSRFGERLLRSTLYKALVSPIDETPDDPEVEESKPAGEKTLIRQIIKFCIVGGTSFVIDFGLTFLFLRILPWNGMLLSESLGTWLQSSIPALFSWAKDAPTAAVPILGGLASFIAMFNSFIWNRSWTFRVKGKAERIAQLRRFYTVSILGAVWNTLIFSAMSNIVPGHVNWSLFVAKVISAGVVAVWNFLGQRYYAFRVAK